MTKSTTVKVLCEKHKGEGKLNLWDDGFISFWHESLEPSILNVGEGIGNVIVCV